MRKSYIREQSVQLIVEINLGELTQLIEIVEGAASVEGASWRVRDALEKLQTAKREAAQEAVREFTRLAE